MSMLRTVQKEIAATEVEFRWSLLVWLACLMIVVLLSNCSSPNVHSPIVTCGGTSQGIDWYEIGRRDGAIGAPLNLLSEYQAQCRKDKNHPDTELYANGRNAGLVEYCTAQVGLETARFGHTYANVCPMHMEKTFLKGYRAGQKIRVLETANTSLDGQIATLSRSVAAVDGAADASQTANVTGGTAANRSPASATEITHTRVKIESLRKERASNDDAITGLEKTIQQTAP